MNFTVKNFCTAFMASALLISTSCTSQNTQTTASKQIVQKALEDSNFTFQARSVHPMDADVIRLMNQKTVGSFQNLEYGYFLSEHDGVLKTALPYYGRAYTVSYSQSREDSGVYLDTTKYQKTTSVNRKGLTTVKYSIEGDSKIQQIILDTGRDGYATLTVLFSDRQPMKYGGVTEPYKAPESASSK